jgi:predicted XRE-type DNA-binding protein
MKEDLTVTRGSGNIFADLGLADADEHMLKARIVAFLAERIKQLRLTQRAAAARMGLAQPDVSKLLRGNFDGFSLERLLGFTRALGSDVEIKVTSHHEHEHRQGRMRLMVA